MDKNPHAKKSVAVGAALGILTVWALTEFGGVEFSGEMGATVGGAFGVVFSWLGRYLPQPPA